MLPPGEAPHNMHQCVSSLPAGVPGRRALRPALLALCLAAACTDDLLRWFAHDTDVTRIDLFATAGGSRIYTARGFTVREFPAMCLPVPR